MEVQREFAPDLFVWLLETACRLHRIPFDGSLILKQCPPPYTLQKVEQVLGELGFQANFSQCSEERLSELPGPCFAQFELPSGAEEGGSAALYFVLLIRHDGDRALLVEPGQAAPIELTAGDVGQRYRGTVLQFIPSIKPAADPETPAGKPAEFGFRWFLPELLKHRRIWRDILLASLAIQLVGLATPLFTQVVIDKVVVHQTLSTLAVIGIGLFVFMVFTALMTWVRQYLVLHTGNRVDAVLGTRVFEHMLGLSPRYFEQRPTGVVIARIHGVENIREFITGAAVSLLLDLPFLLIFLAVMFAYSWQLSLIAVGLLGAVALLSFIAAPVIRTRLNGQFMVGARNQAFLTEYVAGFETVKSLQMEPLLKQRYGDYLAEYLAATFRTKQLYNTYSVAANTLEQLMTLAVLCTGAWLVMKNNGFTVGMLVAFQMFSGRLSQPLLRLVGLWQEFQQAGISVKRLGDILNAPVEPISLIPQRGKTEAGRVDVESIAFRYDKDRPFLYQNLSLSLKPGKVLALMGPSGSGKSTLAKMFQGFHFPEEGRILLDGRDIRHLAANELRAPFGIVPQETILFSGTVYDNLLLANPHASFEQVVQACQWAEIHQAIEQLPKGYQTELGERGVGLSGGQKQRIAIARALLKQPRILIFDEATANLDAQTAEHFAKTINKLRGRATMLFIAHQLPKGLHVDEVVTLGAHGAKVAVVEEGVAT